MIEANGSPELPSNAAQNAAPATHTPARIAGIERRTIVKGAAWSLPVIALAVGAPAQAASATFNIAVNSGCLVGIVGVNLIPGYSIHETHNVTPPTTLTFTETYKSVIPITWIVGGHGVAIVLANTVAAAIGLVVLATSSIGGKSANISVGAYSSFDGVESGIVDNGLSGGHSTMTYTATRTITVSNMVKNSTVGYGYLATINLPNLQGLTVTNTSTLAANSGSGGTPGTDDNAVLTGAILFSHCTV